VNEEDKKIEITSYEWAKKKENWFKIAQITISNVCPQPSNPYALFMAGSPGAGKTEFSKHFLDTSELSKEIVRIDPDEIRLKILGYESGKAHLVQRATSKVVEKIYDEVINSRRNFLLDGTLSNRDKALENIARVLSRGYFVRINFVYQDPFVAWDFAKKRESVEGRNIPKERFIDQFFESRRLVNEIKKKYGNEIVVDLIRRNIRTGSYDYSINIDSLDGFIDDSYSRDYLINELS
jgi:UDP-N-acetylglucosamine kinase